MCVRVFTALLLLAVRGPSAAAQPAVAAAPVPAVLAALEQPAPEALSALWDTLPARPPAPLFTHALVTAEAQRMAREHPALISLDTIGQSVEGRDLWHLTVGRGPVRVLLWSQMHGDEPSATPALFDLLEALAPHRQAPRVARLLDRLTLDIVPMSIPTARSGTSVATPSSSTSIATRCGCRRPRGAP